MQLIQWQRGGKYSGRGKWLLKVNMACCPASHSTTAARKVNYSWAAFPIHSLKARTSTIIIMLYSCCVNAGANHEKRRLLGVWREGFWSSGKGRVAKLSLAWSTSCVYMGWGWKAGESMARASSPKLELWHLHTKVLGLGLFRSHPWKPPQPCWDSLRKLFSCGSISQKKKNILKVNWITATESLRECLMGPLINDSGSQWDIAFGLMPCSAPEAPCNEHTKRAPSSLGALAQNTPAFNVCWMAKWCLQ